MMMAMISCMHGHDGDSVGNVLMIDDDDSDGGGVGDGNDSHGDHDGDRNGDDTDFKGYVMTTE